jgi:hypothetical protein
MGFMTFRIFFIAPFLGRSVTSFLPSWGVLLFLAACVCWGRTLCVSGDLSEVASPTGGGLRS